MTARRTSLLTKHVVRVLMGYVCLGKVMVASQSTENIFSLQTRFAIHILLRLQCCCSERWHVLKAVQEDCIKFENWNKTFFASFCIRKVISGEFCYKICLIESLLNLLCGRKIISVFSSNLLCIRYHLAVTYEGSRKPEWVVQFPVPQIFLLKDYIFLDKSSNLVF